jgi:hypothetical protein
LVTAPGRWDAVAPAGAGVVRVAARVVEAAPRCGLEDAATVGVPVVVEHPGAPRAIAQAIAAAGTTRHVIMHPVKRKR